MSNPNKPKGNISKLVKDHEKGYLLEVELSYPHDLHDLHNNFSFMCEKRKINGVQKLVPNLYNKEKCLIHAHCGSFSSAQTWISFAMNPLGH